MKVLTTSLARTIALLAVLVSCLMLAPTGQEYASVQAMETPKAERIYPVGRKLLFSLYSVTEPELSSAQADGFTAIGPYYTDIDQAADRARSAGLPYLHTVGPRINFEEQSWGEAEQTAALEALVEEVRTESRQPRLAYWYLANEEPRFWRTDEMSWLEQSVNAIRIHDPGQRPIILYEPNHRVVSELEQTSVFVDTVAKGSYADLVGMKDQRSWIRWSVEQVVAAAESNNAIPVSVLLMYQDQESAADIAAIHDRARHDVFLSLISGAKGILVFSGSNTRPGFERDFQADSDGYASAARELNLEQNLAEIFLFGNPADSPIVEIVGGPDVLSFDYLEETHTYPSVSALTKSMYGRTFLFLVNSANSPVTVSIGGLPNDVIVEDYLDDRPLSAQETSMLVLAAYEFRALAWLP